MRIWEKNLLKYIYIVVSLKIPLKKTIQKKSKFHVLHKHAFKAQLQWL